MDGQDWNPVVLKKPANFKLKPDEKGQDNAPSLSSMLTPNYEKDEKVEEQAKKKIRFTDKLSMAKSRIQSGYKNQNSLSEATRGKISVKRINELESGKGKVPTGPEKQILFKLIKMKFS